MSSQSCWLCIFRTRRSLGIQVIRYFTSVLCSKIPIHNTQLNQRQQTNLPPRPFPPLSPLQLRLIKTHPLQHPPRRHPPRHNHNQHPPLHLPIPRHVHLHRLRRTQSRDASPLHPPHLPKFPNASTRSSSTSNPHPSRQHIPHRRKSFRRTTIPLPSRSI